ncbi:STING domain-containing protein [Rhodohalobacter halophilus]|uniref:STING domain-containing protein n=1 Tax=Rhodohalobacter halophilus TaxID=1812810 RepID=UPI00083F5303|nr:STING domain-containing protein [Rhodohalobacter halophilus]
MKWKEFLSVMDFGISLMPSIVSIMGTLPYFERPWIPVIIGIAVLFGLIALFIHNNLGKKEKALAEILATGYFINFLEPMARNIGKRTEVRFRDEHKSMHFDINSIEITVYMPMNSDSLDQISDVLNNQKGYQNIDIINAKDGTPFWSRAKVEGDRLKIADFPRTLFSLPRFVKISLGQTKPKKIRQYYEGFAEQLEDLLEDNRQDYVLRRIKVEKV